MPRSVSVCMCVCLFVCVRVPTGSKEDVLFNDTLNIFYLRLYGIRHNMVKDNSDSERGNPLLPHRLLFLTERIIHTTAFFYTSRGTLA